MRYGASAFESLSGREWQTLCVRVLHQHHGPGELIEIPDTDGGDGGLEAFSMDGCAYQCYAPENEPLENKIRLNKQSNKMRTDVRKFIDNSDKLSKLMPDGLKIRRWILLVPKITSKQLHEHAAKQTGIIRSALLPYAHEEIVAMAHTLDSYEAACHAVVARKLDYLDLPALETMSLAEIADPLIDRMHEKLSKTPRFADSRRRLSFVERLLENNIAGRSHRSWIQDHFSELGDDLEDRFSDLENRLEVQYALEEPDPSRLLATVLAQAESVVTEALNTKPDRSRVIAEGQVAEWLMKCPLDFL